MQRQLAVLIVQERSVVGNRLLCVRGHTCIVAEVSIRRAILAAFQWVWFASVGFSKNIRCSLGVQAFLLLACPVSAEPRVGDCVLFREGGAGLLFRTPTYWLRGSIAGISSERRLAGRCPEIGKPESAYTHNDWVRVASAMPCVQGDAEVREVPVVRISVAVEAWETPWSNLHGTAGWLFRGYFLDKPLKKGDLIDMDASWLEYCPG